MTQLWDWSAPFKAIGKAVKEWGGVWRWAFPPDPPKTPAPPKEPK